jgi:hypothetical protein
MRRVGEIDDIVGAILYLEEASFVTGEILHVDGGQSAGHRRRRHVARPGFRESDVSLASTDALTSNRLLRQNVWESARYTTHDNLIASQRFGRRLLSTGAQLRSNDTIAKV